ncbi:MAG: hypothetical protein K0S74_910 [Chlamydiales bacterium]|nr:hypothetical protein [Chlamydiales bacterium]
MDKLAAHYFLQHVKKVFSKEKIRDLREDITKLEQLIQPDSLTEREKLALERGESADSLRKETCWYELWKNLNPTFINFLTPFTWLIFPIQVRAVQDIKQFAPWHQDIGFQKALKDRGHRQVMTCFIPLEENPVNHTTLQFSLKKTDFIEHKPLNGYSAGIENYPFSQLCHYQLELGDALLFGDLVPHRTFLPEEGQVYRRSFEFRLIDPIDALDDKDYYDIVSGKFVRKNAKSMLEV